MTKQTIGGHRLPDFKACYKAVIKCSNGIGMDTETDKRDMNLEIDCIHTITWFKTKMPLEFREWKECLSNKVFWETGYS